MRAVFAVNTNQTPAGLVPPPEEDQGGYMFYRATSFLLFLSLSAFFNLHISAQATVALKDPANNNKNSFLPKAGPGPSATSVAASTSVAEKRLRAILLNNQAIKLAGSGNYADAASVLQQAINADGTIINTYINLSVVYDHMERYEDALMAAYSALSIDPKRRPVRIQVCQLMASLERVDDAVKCYEGLGKLDGDDPIVKRAYGTTLLHRGEWAKAQTIFSQLLQTDPNDSNLYCGLGFAQYNRKKFKDALASYRRALEFAPEAKPAHFNLAVVLLALKRRPEAIEQYQYLRSTDPELAEQLYENIYADKLLVLDDGQKRNKN